LSPSTAGAAGAAKTKDMMKVITAYSRGESDVRGIGSDDDEGDYSLQRWRKRRQGHWQQ